MKSDFSKCGKCGYVWPAKSLDGGLCWLCAGYRRPPACLRDKPPICDPPIQCENVPCATAYGVPADIEAAIPLQRELNALQSARMERMLGAVEAEPLQLVADPATAFAERDIEGRIGPDDD